MGKRETVNWPFDARTDPKADLRPPCEFETGDQRRPTEISLEQI